MPDRPDSSRDAPPIGRPTTTSVVTKCAAMNTCLDQMRCISATKFQAPAGGKLDLAPSPSPSVSCTSQSIPCDQTLLGVNSSAVPAHPGRRPAARW